jgi:hypothetical protein
MAGLGRPIVGRTSLASTSGQRRGAREGQLSVLDDAGIRTCVIGALAVHRWGQRLRALQLKTQRAAQ